MASYIEVPVCTGDTSAVSTLHCALEKGADLHVNESQKIPHYCARSTEERRRSHRVGRLYK